MTLFGFGDDNDDVEDEEADGYDDESVPGLLDDSSSLASSDIFCGLRTPVTEMVHHTCKSGTSSASLHCFPQECKAGMDMCIDSPAIDDPVTDGPSIVEPAVDGKHRATELLLEQRIAESEIADSELLQCHEQWMSELEDQLVMVGDDDDAVF
jgi:hypothetical protein